MGSEEKGVYGEMALCDPRIFNVPKESGVRGCGMQHLPNN